MGTDHVFYFHYEKRGLSPFFNFLFFHYTVSYFMFKVIIKSDIIYLNINEKWKPHVRNQMDKKSSKTTQKA